MHQGVLYDKTAHGHSEHEAQTPPENQRACDDGLLRLRRRRQDGHECARKLKALTDGLGNENEEVDDGGHAAVQKAEDDASGKVPHRAGHDGPLEAAGPSDGEAGRGADDGGRDGGEGEA